MPTAPPYYYHFGAGPGCLPRSVLSRLAESIEPELLLKGKVDSESDLPIWLRPASGHQPLPVENSIPKDTLHPLLSIAELSHRSPRFEWILYDAKDRLYKLLQIPKDRYDILFLQGGASLQFYMIPLHLVTRSSEKPVKGVYFVTGTWSQKAMDEAKRIGGIEAVQPFQLKSFTGIPDMKEWNKEDLLDASYYYVCDNETIHGVRFPLDLLPFRHPNVPTDACLISDMSSCLLTRPIEEGVEKYKMIYASAQKNMGIAGLVIVIADKDWLCSKSLQPLSPMLDYRTQSMANSTYNTAPTVAIYTLNLMLRWMENTFHGDLRHVAEFHQRLARKIYKVMDESEGFYSCPVHLTCRSPINIVFRISTSKDSKFDEKVESEFAKEAQDKHNILELKGHRSVGGLRVSLYNAIEEKGVDILVCLMQEFKNRHTD